MTNLPEREVRASVACAWYRKRWTRETVLPEIPTTLSGAVPRPGYPSASRFAFRLALLADNAGSVRKAAWRRAKGAERVTESLSGCDVALEIRQASDGRGVGIGPPEWLVFGRATAEAMAAWLPRVAAGVDRNRYRKHPRGPKKPPPTKSADHNGSHGSTEKILRKRKKTG